MSFKNTLNRRHFLSSAATLGVGGTLGAGTILSSCTGVKNEAKYTPLRPENEIYIPDLPDKAVDGKPLKAALIGCGSRGTGAAFNFLEAGDNLSIVALADMFPDRMESCRKELREKKGVTIPDNACFLGFDAYRKACDMPIDIAIVTSPSCFHPEHTRYAVEKGKNVFVEKPAAIDPVGYRSFMMSLRQAKSKGLNVMNGAQYHWDRPFVESYKMIQAGYIGKILTGNVFYNTNNEDYLRRQPGWTDTEFMLRSFFNWNQINGDQVSNMLIHWIDVFVWFAHAKPVKVSAYGSRIRRIAGNVYDNFSMDFEFEGGVRMFGMVRRMDRCNNMRGAIIYGEKGIWNSDDFSIRDLAGNVVWKYDTEAAKAKYKTDNMYTLEHIDFVNHIRKGTVLDVTEINATSAMACIMARESAYSGRVVTWDNMIASELNLMPAEFASEQHGTMDMQKYETVPLPGIPVVIK